MAETERTWTALQALLADNTVEAISPMDLRDAIVSCLGGYASVYVDANVTAQAFIATPVKLAIFTDAGPARGASGSPAADNITVGVAGTYLVQLHLGGCLATIGSVYDVQVFQNGVAVPGLCGRLALDNAQEKAITLSGIVVLLAGGIIDARLSCAPASSATVRNAHLSVKRIG
jgi:hypothetical protein